MTMILIDTSSIMEDSFETFCINRAKDSNAPRITIVNAVYKELMKHIQSSDDNKKHQANRALQTLAVYDNLFIINQEFDSIEAQIISNSPKHADSVFINIVNGYRYHYDISVITQDRKLAVDLNSISNLQSSHSNKEVLVYRLSKNGMLQEFKYILCKNCSTKMAVIPNAESFDICRECADKTSQNDTQAKSKFFRTHKIKDKTKNRKQTKQSPDKETSLGDDIASLYGCILALFLICLAIYAYWTDQNYFSLLFMECIPLVFKFLLQLIWGILCFLASVMLSGITKILSWVSSFDLMDWAHVAVVIIGTLHIGVSGLLFIVITILCLSNLIPWSFTGACFLSFLLRGIMDEMGAKIQTIKRKISKN